METVAKGIFCSCPLSDPKNQRLLKNVNYCLVESRISYSISLWGAKEVILNKTFVLQILLLYQTHCKTHFQRLEIFTVPSLYVLKVLITLKLTSWNTQIYQVITP